MDNAAIVAAIQNLSRTTKGVFDAMTLDVPPLLYHFTDTQGLLGILESSTIRVSLATCSTDSSEVIYGVQLARKLIEQAELEGHPAVLRGVSDELSKYPDFPFASEYHPLTASFCAVENSSALWLHYGRSGTGVALGLKSNELCPRAEINLFPVFYHQSEQSALLRKVFSAFATALETQILRVLIEGGSAPVLEWVVRMLTMQVVFCSYIFKDPAFESEKEWRLVGEWTVTPRSGDATDKSGQTQFRVCGGRVIPFVDLQYKPVIPLVELVLGASSAMKRDDTGLHVLLTEIFGEKRIEVRESRIPVRP